MTSSRLERTVLRLNALAAHLSALLLAAMVGIVVVNVVMRHLFQTSLSWSAELARYCLVWSALLAAAVLVSRREHLAVDVLVRHLGDPQQRRLQILESVLSLTFYAVLFVSGTMLTVSTSGQVSSSIEFLRMNVVYAIVPISALLMFAGALVCLQQAVQDEDAGS